MDNIAALLEGKIDSQIQKEAHAGHTYVFVTCHPADAKKWNNKMKISSNEPKKQDKMYTRHSPLEVAP